jgi:hypothetical protein
MENERLAVIDEKPTMTPKSEYICVRDLARTYKTAEHRGSYKERGKA